MTALLHASANLARLRWLGAAFCVLAMLCSTTHASALARPITNDRVGATITTTKIASAIEHEQPQTRVGGFEQKPPLNVWHFASASAETHRGISSAQNEMASAFSHAAEGVATPWGVAMQEATPAAEAALADAQAGATVFREGVFGVQETTGAQFWSLSNPAATPGYAAQMGMPGGAAQSDWIMGGTLQNGATAITRGAPGIGVNIGGGMEVVVQPGGVGGLWFHMP